MGAQPHTDTNQHPTICMVVACGKKALYRSAQSTRGYCAAHKALAVNAPHSPAHTDWLETRDRLRQVDAYDGE